jgi:hypothetical protein
LEEIKPNDSASCISQHTDPVEEVDVPQPEKQDFVDMIRRVALKETPKEVVEQGVDPMRDMFGSSEAYKADKESKPGLPLSGHQRKLLEKVLQTDEPSKLKKIKVKTGISFEEDVFNDFLRTPVINPEAEDYLSYVNKPQKQASFAKGKGKPTYKNKLAKAIDVDLMSMDRLARGGIRQAAFGQWLTTTMKMLLVSELGPGHELTREDGELCKILNQLFQCADAQLDFFGRSAVMSTLARRKLFLNELALLEEPHNRAMDLPLDHQGRYLFGSYRDDNDNVVGFETIPPDFAKKMVSIREARAALKNPRTLSLPKGLPREEGKNTGFSRNKDDKVKDHSQRDRHNQRGRATSKPFTRQQPPKRKGSFQQRPEFQAKKPFQGPPGAKDGKKPPFRKGGGGGWRK